MATPTQIRRRGRWSLILGTFFAFVAVAAVAYADNLKDTLAVGSVANPSISEGGSFSTTINYQIEKTGSNNTSFPATVNFELSGAPAWVSLSASSLSFTGYGDVKSITVSGTAPSGSGGATYNFSVTPSSSANNLNVAPAVLAMSVSVSAPEPPPDLTAPVITPSIVGTLGSNGWYTSNVSLSWTVVDNESAISSQSGCDAVNITADQASTDYTCSATSAGGTTSQTVSIKRDATPPSVSGSATTSPNDAGWYKNDVAIGWTCSDDTSGLAAGCPANSTISSEGLALTASSGDVFDNAGNSASAVSSPAVNIDKTAPSVSLVGGPADGASYYFGFVPAAPTCSALDALSGLAGSCSVSGYGSTVGSHTVKASATDIAGNSAEASNSYSVLAWTLNGFYQPVDMSNGTIVWNTVKNGSTVPLKFEVFAGATELTATSAVNQPLKAEGVACGTGTADDIELVSTGGTSLRYDAIAGQFIYNWQTPKLVGKCYRVIVGTADGSSLQAYFKLK